jgi:ribonuclease P protein component
LTPHDSGAAGQRFGPDARLKNRAEFDLVYKQGRRVGGRHFLCFFKNTEALGNPPRLGITIGRKVGKAVRRNRLRRVTREFFRLRRSEMRRGVDVVVNLRVGSAGQTTSALWGDLEAIFKRAGVINMPPESRE